MHFWYDLDRDVDGVFVYSDYVTLFGYNLIKESEYTVYISIDYYFLESWKIFIKGIQPWSLNTRNVVHVTLEVCNIRNLNNHINLSNETRMIEFIKINALK